MSVSPEALHAAAIKQRTDFAAQGQPVPVLHEISVYVAGQKDYDDSFSIRIGDTFLGECGAAYTPARVESLGSADAINVWLYDHVSSETNAYTFAARDGYEKPMLVQKLSSEGEVLLAGTGEHVTIISRHLKLYVRILSLDADNATFRHMSVELAVWDMRT